VLRKQAELVKVLLTRNDVNVNARDSIGISPLLIAVRVEDAKVVKLLLGRKDVDVNLKDGNGMTLQQLATKN